MNIAYYESDSPCRRCNGVQRARVVGTREAWCTTCVADRERDQRFAAWVTRTRVPDAPGDAGDSDEVQS